MKYTTILLLVTLFFFSCHTHDHSEDDHNHGDSNGQAGDDHEDEIALTAEQMKNIGLQYGKIEGRKIKSTVKLTGRVELPPSGKSIASSNLDGRITNVSVTAGQTVRKGQVLFTIQNLELIDWQRDLAQAKARAQYLNKETERQKTLADESIAPAKNYEGMMAELQQTRSTIKALKTKLDAIGISSDHGDDFRTTFQVYAPSTGVVQHLQASNGEYIIASMPLAQIIDNDHLHLHLYAYGPDITLLEKGQILRFYVQSRPEKVLEAKVKWINALVNEESNSYDVHAEIMGNSEGLSPGEFVEARVINQEQMLNTLPIQAVTNDKGLKYIFVKEEEHEGETHFVKLQIQPGEMDLGYIGIQPIDPIPEDAQIVVEGAFFLMAESKKGEAAAGGHSHAH